MSQLLGHALDEHVVIGVWVCLVDRVPLLVNNRRVIGAMDASPWLSLQIIVVIALLIGTCESLLILCSNRLFNLRMMIQRVVLSHPSPVISIHFQNGTLLVGVMTH